MMLHPLPPNLLQQELATAVRQTVLARLENAQKGHCLRVSNLAEPLMRDLCRELSHDPRYYVVLLLGPWQPATQPWEVSATRLIELRNAAERPLLVFAPPGIKTAAEDSFDISTFVEMDLSEIPQQTAHTLYERLPNEVQALTNAVLDFIRRQQRIDDTAIIRYYLTILANDAQPAAVGGALYELGLVPHFNLSRYPDQIRQRLDQNMGAMRTLLSGTGPLLGRIHKIKLQPNTLQSPLYHFLKVQTLDAVEQWGALVATEATWHHLAFDQWQFEREVPTGNRLLIFVDDMDDLPPREKEIPIGPDNPRYLDIKTAKNVRIRWSTDPKPTLVPDLTYFRIELVSTAERGVAGGAVAWESKNIPLGKNLKAERSKSFKVSTLPEVEDGLYFFRVRAYTRTGEILNEEDAEADPRILRDDTNPESKRFHESEDVWFWNDPKAEPPPVDPVRNLAVESFLEAQTLVRMAAIEREQDPFNPTLKPQTDKTDWAVAKGQRVEAIYNIVFNAQTRFTISISNRLRQLESDTLREPTTLGRWRWNLVNIRDAQTKVPEVRAYRHAERIPSDFLRARSELFTAVQGGKADRLTATVDLSEFGELILAYANAYLAWLTEVTKNFEQQAIIGEGSRRRTDPLFLDIDTVEVLLSGDGQNRHRVLLLAPTHPLRMLWHWQRTNLVQSWLHAALESDQPTALLNECVKNFLRRGLAPLNLPPTFRASPEELAEGVARFYVEQGPLTPFWSLYLREDVKDSRTIRARLQSILGITQSVTAAIQPTQEGLVRNLQRYLVQHPYVHTLKLNLFNPGDARLIVDAILELERAWRIKRHLPELRYEVRLFSQSERLDEVGAAVDELLNPERQVSEEADAFIESGDNPLYPKLHFSRNHVSDFLPRQEQLETHISILYDLFPVRVVLLPLQAGRSSFLHGLIQEQTTFFTGDEEYTIWQRQLHPGYSCELPATSYPIADILADILTKMGQLQASVATGKLQTTLPSLEVRLEPEQKSLLHQIHEKSDWVFIIDRNLGLEYFDSEAPDDRSTYLLDFRPEFGNTEASRLLVTTRSVDEIQRLIRPVLEKYNLLVGHEIEFYFLRLLRSLSGRLAFKLLSAPTQAKEAIGLALARLLLEQYDLLENRIVLPLDAHTELFASANEDALKNDVSLQRSDLLLISCDALTRTLHFQIVEVKLLTDLGSFSTQVSLEESIEQQISNTISVLHHHFRLHSAPTDRLDRHLKHKELISLLSFYLARSLRYGLIRKEIADSLRTFIEDLDQGYKLVCSGVGLMFDLGGQGIITHEEHANLIFHRIGRDYIERLLGNVQRRRLLLQDQAKAKPSTVEEIEQAQSTREQILRNTTLRNDETYPRVRTLFAPVHLAAMPFKQPDEHTIAQATASQRNTDIGIFQPEQGSNLQAEPLPHPSPEIRLTVESSAQANQPQINAVTEQQTTEALEQNENNKQTEVRQNSIENSEPLDQPDLSRDTTSLPEQSKKMDEDQSAIEPPQYDLLVGSDTTQPKQYGVLGNAHGKRVAIDLNGTNTISLFGVQGGGKSYTVGTIVEMATQAFPGANLLPAPLATVIFHYHESQDYPPEFVSMIAANRNVNESSILAREYGTEVGALQDVVILTPADKVEARKAEFPGVQVEPIHFSSSELSIKDWRFLMGVAGNQMYMKQINMVMRQLRDNLTLDTLRAEIEASDLSDGQKKVARNRLLLAGQFINDAYRLADTLRPGRLIIVDLRDEYIDKEEALGLFVVMLNIFANAGREEGYNKLIVFDEAHKYMDNPDLTSHIVDVIRQMRHQGVSVLIASQDPPSLPNAIIELSSLIVLHRFNSPQWLKHIQKSITALAELTPTQMGALQPGDAYIWSTKATESVFTQKAVKIRLRPRITQHGGGTKTAV